MTYTTLSPQEIRQAVYDEAKRQFLLRGIDQVEMKQLAQTVGIGRTTLYRYYPSIDHLALMTMTELIQMVNNDTAMATLEGQSGYDALRLHYCQLIDTLISHPQVTRFMAQFDLRYQGHYPSIPEADAYRDILMKQYGRQSALFQRGIADGSIRPDADIGKALYAVLHAVVGYAQRTQDHAFGAETRRDHMLWIVDSLLGSVKASVSS